jgi:hypothetical protein
MRDGSTDQPKCAADAQWNDGPIDTERREGEGEDACALLATGARPCPAFVKE